MEWFRDGTLLSYALGKIWLCSLQHSILVRIFRLQQYFKVIYLGFPVCGINSAVCLFIC